MRRFFKMVTVAAAMAGAGFLSTAPARADSNFSISIGVPGIAFSYDSGGYCDRWGCPNNYWDMPIFYGPVYFGGQWYRGPVYYRRVGGVYWYWIHGGWHRDQWRGPRPDWYRRGNYHYGRALGHDYYRGHGFRHAEDSHWRRYDQRMHRRDERRDHRRDERRDHRRDRDRDHHGDHGH